MIFLLLLLFLVQSKTISFAVQPSVNYCLWTARSLVFLLLLLFFYGWTCIAYTQYKKVDAILKTERKGAKGRMISGQIALHSAQLSLHVLFERDVKIIRFLAQKFNLRLTCQLYSLSQRLRSFSFWQRKFRPIISTAKLIERFFSVCDHCVTRWREQRCLLTTAVNLSVR